MRAKSSFRDAVLEDGRFVLYQVTYRLYEGNNLRPDVYFQRNEYLRRKDYNKIFNDGQREIIEESGMEEDYDIKSGALCFDVCLHALLAKHVCGLTKDHPLYKKVQKVKDIRNIVSHPHEPINVGQQISQSSIDISDGNLNEKLEELRMLYGSIINDLEDITDDNLNSIKMEIDNMIKLRKLPTRQETETVYVTREMPTWMPPRQERELIYAPREMPAQMPTRQERESVYVPREMPTRMPTKRETDSGSNEMPTWGKVAVGTAIGVGALALVGALANSSTEDRKKEEKKRNQIGANKSNKEECVVM